MANTWIYQKNFALVNTNKINLKNKKVKKDCFLQDYNYPRNLFDEGSKLIRSVSISELDEKLVDDKNCNIYLEKMKSIEKLIIINDRPTNNQKIYKDYANQILKSYIMMFESNGIDCYYAE